MNQQQPNLDHQTVFDQLWGITNELRQKLEARFELQLDPATQKFQEYSSHDGNIKGSLTTFSGGEIDWLVHSWLRNPEKSFSTMRLTTWLKSDIQVPHLAIEFTTLPYILFYIDYIPRTDPLIDLNYLDRYYEPVNETFLKLQTNTNLKLFTSRSVYVRLIQSPISLCFTGAAAVDTIELTRTVAHEMLDRWLTWVNEAEVVPEDTKRALTERDLLLRRHSAERDPGNQVAAKMLGAELTDKLVRSLWGGDRIL